MELNKNFHVSQTWKTKESRHSTMVSYFVPELYFTYFKLKISVLYFHNYLRLELENVKLKIKNRKQAN